jgi:WhiB family transcriptional regulator, redox-sensing transcriptional regulator
MAAVEDWRQRALCAGHPNRHWWFDDVQESTSKAFALCHACPVNHDCLTHALRYEETYGVWGGTTPSDRRRMMRAQRRHIVRADSA